MCVPTVLSKLYGYYRFIELWILKLVFSICNLYGFFSNPFCFLSMFYIYIITIICTNFCSFLESVLIFQVVKYNPIIMSTFLPALAYGYATTLAHLTSHLGTDVMGCFQVTSYPILLSRYCITCF